MTVALRPSSAWEPLPCQNHKNGISYSKGARVPNDDTSSVRRCFLDEHAVQAVAIAEILHPTLAITLQFLAVNTIVFKEHVPVVEDVILREEEQMAEVYFPIESERYYFVVYVDLEPQVAIRQTGMSAGNRVYFYAKSRERPVDELVAMAGVEPTRIWEKGKHIPRHSGFEVRPSLKDTGEVEDKLRTIISVLLPYTANVHALSAIADVGINIAYWGYKDEMWGIHFGTEIIQGLAALNLSVDVDLYAGGPDLGAC
jgi:Domain of unknown function (DUF4279)